jgi:hypothetical protein
VALVEASQIERNQMWNNLAPRVIEVIDYTHVAHLEVIENRNSLFGPRSLRYNALLSPRFSVFCACGKRLARKADPPDAAHYMCEFFFCSEMVG